MIFPDITNVANFIIREQIRGGAEVNSFEEILVALMNDKQIVSAEIKNGRGENERSRPLVINRTLLVN